MEESEGRASERLQVLEEQQRRTDIERLKMLSIAHLVVGILTALVSCAFILHIVMGIVMLTNPSALSSKNEPAPPAFMGAMFVIMGSLVVLGGWSVGALSILASRHLRNRTGKKLIQVASGLMCINMPLGTILGVFTFIVLERPYVRRLFDQGV